MRALGVVTVWVLAGVSVVGCAEKKVDAVPSPAVASFGGQVISRAAFEAELARQPEYVRVHYSTIEKKREFLESMVRQQLLADEARAQGLERDAELQDKVQKLLVQQLLKKSLGDAQLPDGAARAYYEAHRDEYSRPARTRVSAMLWATRAAESDNVAAKLEATKALTQLRALKGDARTAAFVALVRTKSDHDGSRAQDGDLGPRTKDELTQQWGEAVSSVAFGLQTPGDLALVDSTRGLLLIELTAKQPGEEHSFESVSQSITSRLSAEQRSKALEELVVKLKANHPVVVDDGELAKVVVGAPSGPLLPHAATP